MRALIAARVACALWCAAPVFLVMYASQNATDLRWASALRSIAVDKARIEGKPLADDAPVVTAESVAAARNWLLAGAPTAVGLLLLCEILGKLHVIGMALQPGARTEARPQPGPGPQA